MSGMAELSVVVPLKWRDDRGLGELTGYLETLTRLVHEVIVVDGSAEDLFRTHARLWTKSGIRHLAPEDSCANGKVAGVRTGVRAAVGNKVVIADDDVRYEAETLEAMSRLLERAHLVRPQNHFDPLPWHAVWDTGRTLLNRSLGQDHPGTFGVRRDALLHLGGYDGNTLFENLELSRTIRAGGGVEACASGLYVRRIPPSAARFWSQRPRQAYDDTAQPARLMLFLGLAPLICVAVARAPALLPASAGAVVLLAEAGRRRAGGTRVFPARASFTAPLWVLERALLVWPAFAAWLSGVGVAYAGSRIAVAAHSPRLLRRRLRSRPVLGVPGGAESDALMGSVAERADR